MSLTNGAGPLRTMLETAQRNSGDALCDLTVLAVCNDPYRLDTPTGHRNASWFRDAVDRFLPYGTVHLRGLHYRLVAAADVIRPDNGLPYTNTEEAWTFLCDRAAKSGRWLSYVDFDRISDERNAPAEVYVREPEVCYKGLSTETPIEIPELVLPEFWCQIPEEQPYRLCFIGEKTSLKSVLQPIAERTQGELLLPTGEISDTLIAGLAGRAATDKRPTVVFYFSDFDPSGHQMPISLARKLQALRDLKYPSLDIQVLPVALKLNQVRDLGLPSTPLKDTERRADHWRVVMAHEQTEIDALAALDPDTLEEIAWDALKPFYDRTLSRRAQERRQEWTQEANQLLRAHPAYDDVCRKLEDALEAVKLAAEAFHEAQANGTQKLRGLRTPDLEPPEANLTTKTQTPLFSTSERFREATRRLIRYKGLEALNPEVRE
jgi:hypothetical protein